MCIKIPINANVYILKDNFNITVAQLWIVVVMNIIEMCDLCIIYLLLYNCMF